MIIFFCCNRMWYLVIAFIMNAVSAFEKDITFMVQAGKTDCFYYNVLPDQVIDVEYQVIDSTHGELDISFQLADPVGRILVADYKKSENSHRHTAQVHGDYRFCFDNTFSTFSQKTVFFDVMMNGADSAERDYDDDKEMELVDGAQSYMMKVQDISESVSRVKEHISTARRLQELLSAHEARDRNLAEEMCTRVMRWSLIQIMMMLAVGLMQVIFVRSLFEEKGSTNNFKRYLPSFITHS